MCVCVCVCVNFIQAGVDCVICEFVIKEVNSTLAKNASKVSVLMSDYSIYM